MSLEQRLQQEQTARKKAEQQLAEKKRQLNHANQQLADLRKQAELFQQFKEATKNANKARSGFLSSISHELRTSLDGILGYVQILKQYDPLPVTVAEGLDVIYSNSKHLLTLVNDVLDISKAQAEKLELQPGVLNLPDFIQNIVAIAKVWAKQKNLEFVCKKPNKLPDYVLVDEKRLRQVLLNLLSNAVKFTDQGHITLTLTITNATKTDLATCKKIHFEIADSGIGMSSEQAKMIFAPFEQVGDSTRHSAGTGLGLSISWQLVSLMGGQLFCKSKEGKGSVFWFEIVLPAYETPPTPKPTLGDAREVKNSASEAVAKTNPPSFSQNADASPPTPPPQELKQLIEMVSQGRILAVQHKAEQIALRNKDYIPFANKLRRLAKEFKEDQVLALLQSGIRQ